MDMFIANCTLQVQDFQYRLPEKDKLFKQSIPIGQQIRVSGDLTTKDIESIVEQHSPYGMVRADEIDRTKTFVGYCWSEKRIDMARVQRAIEGNKLVLVERGKVIRQEAAIAVNNAVENEAGNDQLKSLEMTVQEDTKDKDREVHETVRVDRSEPSGAPRNSRRRAA